MQTKRIKWRESAGPLVRVAAAGDFCPREVNSDDVARRAAEICREVKPFFDDSDLRLYRFIDDEEDVWREYDGPVTVTDNTTLYFQAVDSFGNVAYLAKAGLAIPDADLLVAAAALSRSCPLASGNVRHFSRIWGLQLHNWFEAPLPALPTRTRASARRSRRRP